MRGKKHHSRMLCHTYLYIRAGTSCFFSMMVLIGGCLFNIGESTAHRYDTEKKEKEIHVVLLKLKNSQPVMTNGTILPPTAIFCKYYERISFSTVFLAHSAIAVGRSMK